MPNISYVRPTRRRFDFFMIIKKPAEKMNVQVMIARAPIHWMPSYLKLPT